MSRVFVAGVVLAISIAFFSPPTIATAEQVCVEMVAGVCLKFQDAPSAAPKPQPAPSAAPVSPAQREERALQLSRSELRDVQAGLRAGGYYDGSLDGAIGSGSRRAISRWQSANDQEVTGYLTFDQVKRIAALTASVQAEPTPTSVVLAPVQEVKQPEPAASTVLDLPAPGQVYRASSDAPPPETWGYTQTMRISVVRRDDETATISMKLSGISRFSFDKDCVVRLDQLADCEFVGPFRNKNTWRLRGELPNVTVTNSVAAFSKGFNFW